jgi:hypothetical protein
LKFRHGFYYDEEMKTKMILSPQKYAPNIKVYANTRYENIKIGIGLGSKSTGRLREEGPGPGAYNLPSIFDKNRKFKYALN